MVWPDKKWEVTGVDVPSGVSNQPMTHTESIRGARTRAENVLEETGADFGVGLEGGLEQIGDDWFECGWIVVKDKDGKIGIGSSVRFRLPEVMVKMIHQGKELGEVTDIISNQENTKQKGGFFGLMSKDLITRQKGYRDGVIAALARFIKPEIFNK
jgi:inosine/xanthosine triphosphatase